jgi:hypothetical protein
MPNPTRQEVPCENDVGDAAARSELLGRQCRYHIWGLGNICSLYDRRWSRREEQRPGRPVIASAAGASICSYAAFGYSDIAAGEAGEVEGPPRQPEPAKKPSSPARNVFSANLAQNRHLAAYMTEAWASRACVHPGFLPGAQAVKGRPSAVNRSAKIAAGQERPQNAISTQGTRGWANHSLP